MSTTWTTSWRLTSGRTALGRSPFAQGFALLLGVAFVVVLIPLLLLAAVVAMLTFAALRVKAWMFTQRQPNGMLDGRRNVRVRLPDEP